MARPFIPTHLLFRGVALPANKINLVLSTPNMNRLSEDRSCPHIKIHRQKESDLPLNEFIVAIERHCHDTCRRHGSTRPAHRPAHRPDSQSRGLNLIKVSFLARTLSTPAVPSAVFPWKSASTHRGIPSTPAFLDFRNATGIKRASY